jgi:hypothetical protein
MKKMIEENLELIVFKRDLLEHILLCVNRDWHNQIDFKNNDSKMKKLLSDNDYFDDSEFGDLIEKIAYNLFIHGKTKVYFKYEYKRKKICHLNILCPWNNKKINKSDYDRRIYLRLPMAIFSPIRRMRILIELKNINSNNYFKKVNSKDYQNSIKFFTEMNTMSKLRILRLTKDLYCPTYNEEYMTDYYFTYWLIKMRIFQRNLVDFVVDVLSKEIRIITNDQDNIIIKGITINSLNKYFNDLMENKTSISDILNNIYQCINV